MNILKINKFLFAVVVLAFSAWASADTYTYDNLNRLKSVAYTVGGGQTYTYDSAGNLVSVVTMAPVPGNYTLTVTKVGTGTGTVSGSGVSCGTTCAPSIASGSTVTLSATSDPGKSFTGWSGYSACASANPCVFTMPAAPVTVTATFSSTGPTYAMTLSASPAAGGTVSGAGSFTSGTAVTATATVNAGYTFSTWTGYAACAGANPCAFNMPAAPVDMVATFVVAASAPVVTLNPTTLTFANQNVGTTSAAKTVTLTNTGNASLTIASIASANNVFAVTNNCGASLAASASCTLNVTFSPTAAVSTSSSIQVNDNATGSPHAVAVSGVGVPAGSPICTLVANPNRVSRSGASTLTASCSPAATSYSWTGGTCVGNTTANCSVAPVLTTTYAVTGTNGSGSNTASATVTVLSGDITPILFLLLFD